MQMTSSQGRIRTSGKFHSKQWAYTQMSHWTFHERPHGLSAKQLTDSKQAILE